MTHDVTVPGDFKMACGHPQRCLFYACGECAEDDNDAMAAMRARAEAAESSLAAAEAQVAALTKSLADCYRATGADPDGNEDWRLAEKAVAEVERFRREFDEEAEGEDRLWTYVETTLKAASPGCYHGLPELVDRVVAEKSKAEARLAAVEGALRKVRGVNFAKHPPDNCGECFPCALDAEIDALLAPAQGKDGAE